MKILLLSAYHATSHQQWADQLIDGLPEHDWQLLTLPPRHFSWRIRGNSLLWAFGDATLLQQPWDLILATSMVDLSTLRGMVPALCKIPTVVYFHENQFDYPTSGMGRPFAIEPCLVSLYSALCADRIVFNSDYNRTTFIEGTDILLNKLPDKFPGTIVKQLKQNSSVLPVPVPACFYQANTRNHSKTDNTYFDIVWNHRWEYDKGPDRLLRCLEQLCTQHQHTTLHLRFHIVGQQFRQRPEAFEKIKTLLEANGWLGQWGFVASRQRYLELLQASCLVLSTALHDFQGLAVLEASAAGCMPVVPNRLAYPEFIADNCRYASDTANPETEARSAAEMINQRYQQWQNRQLELPPFCDLSWKALKTDYENLLASTAGKILP